MTFDIYELIARIRLRPAMYIGKSSVTRLRSYLDGYIHAVQEFDINTTEEPPFYDFHDWIALKLGFYESTSGWNNMLLEAENGDEEKALERFFTFLDEFKERQAKVVYQAVPTTDKVWRYQIVDLATDERIPLKNPSLIQIIKYTDDKGVFIRYFDEHDTLIDREYYCQDLNVAFLKTDSLVKRVEWKRPDDADRFPKNVN